MDSSSILPTQKAINLEKTILSSNATFSDNDKFTSRIHGSEPCNYRTPFHRDYTRIIHSRPFRRLHHKTQVFIAPRNDHICTRLEHCLHVASISRTIALALKLNTDLVEAIAMGHDLGHAPFGHVGEEVLNDLCKDIGGFEHEIHSLRVVDYLESPYFTEKGWRGLNLTFAVRDGIVSHCGEKIDQELIPDVNKPLNNLQNTKKDDCVPATLEGCVVRFADRVAYLGRDFEDAIQYELVQRDNLPNKITSILGKDNRSIIGALIEDITKNSHDLAAIRVSDEVHAALKAFNEFNYEKIYKSDTARKQSSRIETSMKCLYDELSKKVDLYKKDGEVPEHGVESDFLRIFNDYITNDIDDWCSEKTHSLVADFIAGMTDFFYIEMFKDLFLPKSTRL